MDPPVVRKSGYSYCLVNIDCLPHSTHYNILMDLDESVESLLPYLAALLPSCTYVHGSGVVQVMDRGHIVAIYPNRLTITDVRDSEEAEALCDEYHALIARAERERPQLTPVLRKDRTISVLDIYRHLPQTNCGLCRLPTCFAFAAAVLRRESPVTGCTPIEQAPSNFDGLLDLLRTNGYPTP